MVQIKKIQQMRSPEKVFSALVEDFQNYNKINLSEYLAEDTLTLDGHVESLLTFLKTVEMVKVITSEPDEDFLSLSIQIYEDQDEIPHSEIIFCREDMRWRIFDIWLPSIDATEEHFCDSIFGREAP